GADSSEEKFYRRLGRYGGYPSYPQLYQQPPYQPPYQPQPNPYQPYPF
uniref:Statherin n=1 Tax=Aotus nancymaae TaxID=37293 RepID=A0A2K5C8M3_AOTNA